MGLVLLSTRLPDTSYAVRTGLAVCQASFVPASMPELPSPPPISSAVDAHISYITQCRTRFAAGRTEDASACSQIICILCK
jgi:hypothetical protein